MKVNKTLIKNRKELINGMIEDKGYVHCQHCNTSNAFNFQVHHIVWRSEKPGNRFLHSKVNLIILCVTCHDKFHKDKSLRNKLAEERELDKIFGQDVLNK